MKFKRILREPLFYLLLLLAAVYLILIPAQTEISNIKVTRNNRTEAVQLPYSVDMPENEVFTVSFNLLVKNKSTAKFNIIPDNCLQEILINGKKFPLDGTKGLCDWSKGIYFNFSEYIQKGLNHFEFRIINSGGPAGLRVEVPYNGIYSLSFIHYIFALLLLLNIALILRKLKFKIIAIFIILLGVAVRLILYTYTGPLQYAYDTGGHLEYIQIIAEEKRLPKVNEGWSTYHPPLYYIGSAAVKNIVDRYDPTLTNRVLQQANLLISFIGIFLGVAFILNLFGNCRVAYLAALVSVLWPGYVISAPRITNDSLFYLGALFCMFFAHRYWRLHKGSDIFLASLGVAIALAAKSNGLVILGIWVIVYVLSIIRSLKFGSLRVMFASVFIILLSMGLSNYRTIVDIYDGKKVELIGNISGLNSHLGVKNTPGSYLYFDLKDYMLEPYVSPWVDKGGRQYFWNYALKTSLFGEFRLWDSPAGYTVATAINFLSLFIFLLALWGIIHSKFREFPALLYTAALFAALIYIRIKYPYSATTDFRFILPAVFPLVYFSVYGAQILENSRLKKLSYLTLLSFAGLSFLIIVGQAF